MIGSLDKAQPFFVVGSALAFTCPTAGELYLGVNDCRPGEQQRRVQRDRHAARRLSADPWDFPTQHAN